MHLASHQLYQQNRHRQCIAPTLAFFLSSGRAEHGRPQGRSAGTRAITRVVVSGLALVAALLVGELPFELRLPAEEDRDEELVGEPSPAELHSPGERGAEASAVMPFKRWNRVYWTSAANGNQGIVILLISKVKGSAGSWTAVDPTGRIQIFDVSDRRRSSVRPKAGVQYTEARSLSPERQVEAIAASDRLEARRDHGALLSEGKSAPSSAPKRHGRRAATFWWAFTGCNSAAVGVWAWRHCGLIGVLLFCGWRVAKFFGLYEFVAAIVAGIQGLEEVVETAQGWKEYVKDLYRTGELEMGVIGLLLVVAGIRWGWPFAEGSDASDASSDEGEPGGTAVSDSEEEPSPRELFKNIMAAQQQVLSEFGRIREGGSAPGTPMKEKVRPKIDGDEDSWDRSSGSSRGTSAGEARVVTPEPTREQIDDLLRRLDEHGRVVELDSSSSRQAQHGSSPGSVGSFELVKSHTSSPSKDDTSPVRGKIEEIEARARNPRDLALQALKHYKDISLRVGNITTRTAPEMLSRLYKSGRTAKAELREWLRSKELEACPAASEVLVLGMILDRMLENAEVENLVNSRSAELVTLRIYSIMKAYQNVERLGDWKRPAGQSGQKWKSKVNWLLAEQYFKVDEPDTLIEEADDEVTEKLKRKALFQKHLDGAMTSAGPKGDTE